MVPHRIRGNKDGRTEGDNKMFTVAYVPQRVTGQTLITAILNVSPTNEVTELFPGLSSQPVIEVEGLLRLRGSNVGQSAIKTSHTSHTSVSAFSITFEPK